MKNTYAYLLHFTSLQINTEKKQYTEAAIHFNKYLQTKEKGSPTFCALSHVWSYKCFYNCLHVFFLWNSYDCTYTEWYPLKYFSETYILYVSNSDPLELVELKSDERVLMNLKALQVLNNITVMSLR